MSARILVVDDEPDLQLLIAQRFRRQVRDGSFSFAFAQDGVNALAVLADDPAIDMVVTDINMPRMDGLTLLSRLLEREDHLATIIVSAYGDMANIRIAMNRGAFDFLTKPIDFTDLETTIAKTLRNLEITRTYQRRQQEAERARAQFSRYFSPSLADRLAEATEDIDLGAQRRDVTSMFTDIAGFTTLAESLEPSLIAPPLNEYLTGMTEMKVAASALWRRMASPSMSRRSFGNRSLPAYISNDCYVVNDSPTWRTCEHWRSIRTERFIALSVTARAYYHLFWFLFARTERCWASSALIGAKSDRPWRPRSHCLKALLPRL